MKKMIRLFCLLALMIVGSTIYAQKYKTVEDTVKLNKEYMSLSNDIAELSAKLTIAQNDLINLQAKAKDANNDAAEAASTSRDQANKATNGDVKDAKIAKRKANKAYGEAKDSRSAKKKLRKQERSITHYQLNIKKKQHRIEELDIMRAAIHNKS